MAARAPELSDPAARPFTAFRFAVEIDVHGVGNALCGASFSEVDGLEMNIEPKTLQEGGRNTGPVHLLGKTTYGQLTLKRGMTGNFDLWRWFERVTSPGSRGVRAKAEVVVQSSDGTKEQARFILEGCLPVKLKAPPLNSQTGTIAIEEMQIVYERMRVHYPQSGQGGQGAQTQGAQASQPTTAGG